MPRLEYLFTVSRCLASWKFLVFSTTGRRKRKKRHQDNHIPNDKIDKGGWTSNAGHNSWFVYCRKTHDRNHLLKIFKPGKKGMKEFYESFSFSNIQSTASGKVRAGLSLHMFQNAEWPSRMGPGPISSIRKKKKLWSTIQKPQVPNPDEKKKSVEHHRGCPSKVPPKWAISRFFKFSCPSLYSLTRSSRRLILSAVDISALLGTWFPARAWCWQIVVPTGRPPVVRSFFMMRPWEECSEVTWPPGKDR